MDSALLAKEALKLSAVERAQIIDLLWQSLDPAEQSAVPLRRRTDERSPMVRTCPKMPARIGHTRLHFVLYVESAALDAGITRPDRRVYSSVSEAGGRICSGQDVVGEVDGKRAFDRFHWRRTPLPVSLSRQISSRKGSGPLSVTRSRHRHRTLNAMSFRRC